MSPRTLHSSKENAKVNKKTKTKEKEPEREAPSNAGDNDQVSYRLASYSYSAIRASLAASFWNEYVLRKNESLILKIVEVNVNKDISYTLDSKRVALNIVSSLQGKESVVETISVMDEKEPLEVWIVAQAPILGIKYSVMLPDSTDFSKEYRQVELVFEEYQEFVAMTTRLSVLGVPILLTPIPNTSSAYATSDYVSEIVPEVIPEIVPDNVPNMNIIDMPNIVQASSSDNAFDPTHSLRDQILELIEDAGFWDLVDQVDYAWMDLMRR